MATAFVLGLIAVIGLARYFAFSATGALAMALLVLGWWAVDHRAFHSFGDLLLIVAVAAAFPSVLAGMAVVGRADRCWR